MTGLWRNLNRTPMLRRYLEEEGCLGVVRSAAGELRKFRRRGVADLLELTETAPGFLKNAAVADRVIGRGAALLLVRGGVASVYARLISRGACDVLCRAGVEVEYGAVTPYIKNRNGDGQCPVETLTAGTDDPDEAFILIKKFIETQKNRQ